MRSFMAFHSYTLVNCLSELRVELGQSVDRSRWSKHSLL